ncbi:helix-turn-helix transcriptional regulator [Chryseobacterium sp. MMS23-Vi53]|uniref:helix-turn-helix transcriptional regulator n=1 Tax=Chryseobacterium sp. MMS23-Vi53 TaxID=3386644 RepID=UPI0039EA8447
MKNNDTMPSKIILIFALFLFSYFFARPPKIDSIYKIIERSYFDGNFDRKILLKNITDLYYLSKEANDTEGQLLAVFEDSRMNYISGNIDEALFKINEGIDLANRKEDYNIRCRLQLIYLRILLELDHFKESDLVLKKCEYYNSLILDKEEQKINNSFILLSKADLLAVTEKTKFSSIIDLKKKSYANILTVADSNKLKKAAQIHTLQSLAWSTILSGNIAESRKYISNIDHLLVNYPNENFITQNLVLKGMIENSDKNYSNAVKYFSQAILLAEKNNNSYKLYEIYPLISQSYTNLKDFENAASFSLEFRKLSDSIDFIKKMSGDVDLVKKINDKILSEKQTSSNNKFYWTFSIITVLSLVLGFIFFRKFKANKNISNNEELPNIENQDVEYHAVSEDSFSGKELKDQLELTKKLVSLAKEDINAFYVEFKKAHPTFCTFLKEKYPDLNMSDLNFCCLIKMNFGTKEISMYTNSSLRSVESRIYRIKKKMEIKSQNDLYLDISLLK